MSTEENFCKGCEKNSGNIEKGWREIGTDNCGLGNNAVSTLANCAKDCLYFQRHIREIEERG